MYVEVGRSVGVRGLSMDPGGIARIWSNYFPEVEFSMDDRKFKLIAELGEFVSSPQADRFLSQVQDDNGIFFLPIDFQQFQKVCEVKELYAILEEAPKEALLCMGSAVHMALSLKEKNCQLMDIEKINIRLHNHSDSSITLKNLKAAYISCSLAYLPVFKINQSNRERKS